MEDGQSNVINNLLEIDNEVLKDVLFYKANPDFELFAAKGEATLYAFQDFALKITYGALLPFFKGLMLALSTSSDPLLAEEIEDFISANHANLDKDAAGDYLARYKSQNIIRSHKNGEYIQQRDFVSACLYDIATIDDLEDYLNFWLQKTVSTPLREFLGFTEYEYRQWILHGRGTVRDILRCRMDEVPLSEYQSMSDTSRIAARSYDLEEIERMKNEDKNG